MNKIFILLFQITYNFLKNNINILDNINSKNKYKNNQRIVKEFYIYNNINIIYFNEAKDNCTMILKKDSFFS